MDPDPLVFIQTWGAVIAAVGAFMSSSAAFWKMGRVEGLATSWASEIGRLEKRDNDQSDTLKEHGLNLLRLDLHQKATQQKIEELAIEEKDHHRDLSQRITGISNQISELGGDNRERYQKVGKDSS